MEIWRESLMKRNSQVTFWCQTKWCADHGFEWYHIELCFIWGICDDIWWHRSCGAAYLSMIYMRYITWHSPRNDATGKSAVIAQWIHTITQRISQSHNTVLHRTNTHQGTNHANQWSSSYTHGIHTQSRNQCHAAEWYRPIHDGISREDDNQWKCDNNSI